MTFIPHTNRTGFLHARTTQDRLLYFETGLCNHSLKALYLIFISRNILYPGMFNAEKMPKPMLPEVLHATAR